MDMTLVADSENPCKTRGEIRLNDSYDATSRAAEEMLSIHSYEEGKNAENNRGHNLKRQPKAHVH